MFMTSVVEKDKETETEAEKRERKSKKLKTKKIETCSPPTVHK